MNKLFYGTGLLGLAGFMCFGFGKADLGDHSRAVQMMTFGVGVGLPMVAGVGLVDSYRRDRNRITANTAHLRLSTLQSEILKLARVNQGKLTEIEVMSELGIKTVVATEVLTYLYN